MDDATKELYQLVNWHTSQIGAIVAEQRVQSVELKQMKGDHSYICQTLKETEENMTAHFNSRMDQINNTLLELVAQKHRREGEEAALLRTRQDDHEKFNIRIQIFKAIPDLLKMLGYLAIGYALIQQITPHK